MAISEQNIHDSLAFSASFSKKGQTAPTSGCGKFSACNCNSVQIGAGKHGIQAIFVFLQAFVYHFLVAKLALYNTECVLHLRAEYLLLKDDNKTNSEIFAKAITKARHEADALMVGLTAFAELAGYQIEYNMPHSGKISVDKVLETAYTLSHDGVVIRLSVDEMNAFENEVFDSVELQLKHLFKRKGACGNG